MSGDDRVRVCLTRGMTCASALGSEKIDRVEQIGFQIRPHLIKGRSIEQGAAVTVVNVFPNEHVACRADLSFQLNKLALNCTFLLLRVGAHSSVSARLSTVGTLFTRAR